MWERSTRRAFIASGAATLAALAGCSNGSPAGGGSVQTGVDWPMHRHDPANTGADPEATPPDGEPAPAWTFETGTWAQVPSLVDGRLFVGDVDGSFYSIDASGAERWSAQLGHLSASSSPAVIDGTVYVASFGGEGTEPMHALDADTGERRWSSGDAGSPAPVVGADRVFTATQDGEVFALSTGDGSRDWLTSVGGRVTSGPAYAEDTVIVATQAREHDAEEGFVRALDARSGDERWAFETRGTGFSAPAVGNGTVFVPDRPGAVYAIDAAEGAERWVHETGDDITCSPSVAGGRVFVGSHEGRLYALGTDNGGVEWTADGVGFVNVGPAVAGDQVFLGTNRGLFAFDARTGDRRWHVSSDVDLFGAIVSGGTVFTGSSVHGSDDGASGSAGVIAFRA